MADNIRVLNNTTGLIHVAVVIDDNNGPVQQGGYFAIAANGGQLAWTRGVPGATAFVIRGLQPQAAPPEPLHGVEPEIRYVRSGQILVIN